MKPDTNIVYEIKLDEFHAIGRYLDVSNEHESDKMLYEFEILEKISPWAINNVLINTPEYLIRSGSVCKQVGTKEDYPEYFL